MICRYFVSSQNRSRCKGLQSRISNKVLHGHGAGSQARRGPEKWHAWKASSGSAQPRSSHSGWVGLCTCGQGWFAVIISRDLWQLWEQKPDTDDKSGVFQMGWSLHRWPDGCGYDWQTCPSWTLTNLWGEKLPHGACPHAPGCIKVTRQEAGKSLAGNREFSRFF